MISRFGAIARAVRPALNRALPANIVSKSIGPMNSLPKRGYSGVNEAVAKPQAAFFKEEHSLLDSEITEDIDVGSKTDEMVIAEFGAADKTSWTKEQFLQVLAQIDSDLAGALSIVQFMKEKGVGSCSVSYSHVIRIGMKSMSSREIAAVFTEGFYSITNGSENYTAVEQIYSMVRKEGFVLESFVYEKAAWILSRKNNSGWIRAMIDTMERSGIDVPTKVFNCLLHSYSSVPVIDQMHAVYQRMLNKSKVDVSSEAVLLNGYAKSKMEVELERQFEKIKGFANGLTSSVYNIMIGAYLKMNQIEKAGQLYKEMQSRPEIAPTGATLSIFANFFMETGNISELNGLVDEFLASQFKFNWQLSSLMFRCAVKSNIEKAEIIFAKMKTEMRNFHHVELYNTILTSLNDRSVPIDFKAQIAKLLVQKEYPEPTGGWISDLARNLEPSQRNLVFAMETEKVAPNGLTCDIVMKCMMARKEWLNVKVLFGRMTERKLKYSRATLNTYLSAMIRVKDVETIKWILSTMKLNRFKISASNLNSLEVILGHPNLAELTN